MTQADNKQFKVDNRLYDTDYTLFYRVSIRRLKYDDDQQDFIYKNVHNQTESKNFAQVRPEEPIHLRFNIEKILMGRK